VRELGKRILAEWLQKYHGALEGELRDLSPMRSGLPFELVFSEVWHYVFGYASKTLAEEGFTIDPRASGYRYDGYVPLVFASSLHAI
jgi:hypothetical protein